MSALPTFKYHPDPIATGSVVPSEEACACCGRARGFVYDGPVRAADEVAGSLCPWCIADGSAHAGFEAELTDPEAVGGYAGPSRLPRPVVEEVAFRTSGYFAWQHSQWLACCGDAAAFLGRAGRAELEERWQEAIASIREECRMEGEAWRDYFQQLDRDGSPTAYAFRCLHCSRLLGYSDCDGGPDGRPPTGEEMKWYAVAEIDVTDRGWVADYVREVTRMVERHGGRYLARTPKIERLEGERDLPQAFLIIEWPSREAALAFYESEEYRPYRESRRAGSRGLFVLVAGEDVNRLARIG